MKTARAVRILGAVAALVLVALGAGALFVYSGIYNVAATRPHIEPVQWLLETVMRQSVRRHAQAVSVPPLGDRALVARGRALHDEHCVRCHGAPGAAPDSFALGLLPFAANLAYTAREWKPEELYWVIKNGIKMTGMPAWSHRLGDDDLWALVAYLVTLPRESPVQYRATAPATRYSGSPPAGGTAPADPERGRLAVNQYACAACHVIPGIAGAHVTVGPPLANIARRGTLAGMIPNTRDNMIRWLQAPHSIFPEGAMPNLGVTERDARDIAAYLETLKQ